MITAEQALERLRPDLAEVVSAKQRATGSRMLAYEAVGSKLGRSATWVRKVLGRAPDVTVGLHDALNIRAAYERLCASVGAAADAQAAENNRLREEIDAALQRDRAARPRTPGGAPAAGPSARRPGRAAASALVRPNAGSRLPNDPPGVSDLPLWRALEEGE